MSDDHSATTSTAGTVTVGGSATGVIERKGDVDWFAVELVEGRTYVIDLEGAGAGTGTLGDAMLWGLFDDAGVRVAKRSRDGGEGNDARMVFTATESGTHYIAARGQRKDDTGTYTVRVRDQDAGTQAPANTNTVRTPEQTAVQQPPQPPADPDATAAGAAGLGDLAGLGRRGAVRQDSVDGGDDGTDYYSFTLSERQAVTLSLFRQDANADLYLEDGEGTVLASSTEDGTRKDEVKATLDAGTYYVRVAAQEAGENAYTLRAKAADPVAVVPVAPESLPQQHASQQHASQQQQAPDTDATRAGADDLGTLWNWGGVTLKHRLDGSVDGGDDVTDYYRFTTTLLKNVEIKLHRQDADADLYLEDDKGNVLASSTNDGTGQETITVSKLAAGTHYIRVVAQEAGQNDYRLSMKHEMAEEVILDDFSQDTSTKGTVTAGGSATGRIDQVVTIGYDVNDEDWFKVELEAGKIYRFNVDTTPRADGDAFKSTQYSLLELYDKDGKAIGVGSYGKFAFFAPTEAGTYFAAVGINPDIVLPWTGTYTLSVEEVEDDFTADTDTTGAVAVGGQAWGEIEYRGDRDWLKVELEAGETYMIELHGSPKLEGTDGGQVATLRDYHMRGAVYDADGNRIGDDALGWGGLDGQSHNPPGCKEPWINKVEFTPTESGAYYVEVDTSPNAQYGLGTYMVSVAESDFVATEEYTL